VGRAGRAAGPEVDEEPLPGAAFLHGDRRVLLFDSLRRKPRVWDLEKQRLAGEVAKGGIRNGRLSASPDGRRFLTVDRDGLYLWDSADAKLLHPFPAGEGKPGEDFEAIFSRDGKQFLALGYRDGSARLYDAVSGKLLWKLVGGSAVRGAEFAADGKQL